MSETYQQAAHVGTLTLVAVLRRLDDGSWVVLAARGLVGRSAACTLRLTEPQVSGEHARISHVAGEWTLCDLGSRNGTFVNGARVPYGKNLVLAEHDQVAFGNPPSIWTLTDASPPQVLARRLSDDALLPAVHGILALPSAGAPAASVFEANKGSWVIEIGSEVRPAHEGEVIEVEGERFLLHLPAGLATTVQGAAAETRVDDLTLRFRVSRDEEHVEVSVALPDGPRILAPRAHHYTLLTLARARRRDQEVSALSEAQRGWVFVDDLCRSLAVEETRLNVEIHRIRQDFAALGVAGASAIIERRRGSRQLRLATARVTVEIMV